MFGKNIPTCDLPCPNTAVNLMDKAQVLSKFQVAESIMDASAWNLHGNGTSRDHNKISFYTGAEEETFNLDLEYRVVMQLMHRRLLRYHHVYADNYFTTVHLAEDLLP